MSRRNRIAIELAKNGDIVGISSDRVVDVYMVSNHAVASPALSSGS